MEPSRTKSGLKIWNAGYTHPDPVLPTSRRYYHMPNHFWQQKWTREMEMEWGAGQEDKGQSGLRLFRTH